MLPFVTFEGSEACGKSTQIQLLESKLASLGMNVLVTREPGGTPLGESLRHLLKHAPEGQKICAESELLLFAASRAQLCREVIQPHLNESGWVLCDRFADSTTVYQGVARQLETETVARINAFAIGEAKPSLTLVLDLEPEEARRRLEQRDRKRDRIESAGEDFFQRVRTGYLKLAETDPARVKLIPAAGSVEEVFALVWKEVSDGFSLD